MMRKSERTFAQNAKLMGKATALAVASALFLAAAGLSSCARDPAKEAAVSTAPHSAGDNAQEPAVALSPTFSWLDGAQLFKVKADLGKERFVFYYKDKKVARDDAEEFFRLNGMARPNDKAAEAAAAAESKSESKSEAVVGAGAGVGARAPASPSSDSGKEGEQADGPALDQGGRAEAAATKKSEGRPEAQGQPTRDGGKGAKKAAKRDRKAPKKTASPCAGVGDPSNCKTAVVSFADVDAIDAEALESAPKEAAKAGNVLMLSAISLAQSKGFADKHRPLVYGWVEKAAALGNAEARHYDALMTYAGLNGREADPQQAIVSWLALSSSGEKLSSLRLALMRMVGQDVDLDLKAAAELMDKAELLYFPSKTLRACALGKKCPYVKLKTAKDRLAYWKALAANGNAEAKRIQRFVKAMSIGETLDPAGKKDKRLRDLIYN